MMDFEPIRADLLDHARESIPHECCGLVVADRETGELRYLRAQNESESHSHFVLAPRSWIAAKQLGDVVAIAHSHVVVPAEPSMADRVMCEQTNLPWVIISVPSGELRSFEPQGFEAPLVGRAFCHGVLDCYTIVRDYYSRTLGIDLPNFHRAEEWWTKGENLYMELFGQAGFQRVESPPAEHDVLLMQIRSPVPNHAAVFLGNSRILQHLSNRLSTIDVYGGYWTKVTTCHLRHVTQL